jgi:hypothetical protein
MKTTPETREYFLEPEEDGQIAIWVPEHGIAEPPRAKGAALALVLLVLLIPHAGCTRQQTSKAGTSSHMRSRNSQGSSSDAFRLESGGGGRTEFERIYCSNGADLAWGMAGYSGALISRSSSHRPRSERGSKNRASDSPEHSTKFQGLEPQEACHKFGPSCVLHTKGRKLTRLLADSLARSEERGRDRQTDAEPHCLGRSFVHPFKYAVFA